MPGGTLFYNLSAGPRAGAVESLIAEAGKEGLETIRIERSLDISAEVRRRIERGQRLFIAAGGDGTINHVVQSIVNTEAVLAVIPAGTYNHFAKDVGIPLDFNEALDVALHGTEQQIDVARINERYFINNICFGLYPELVARREEKGRDYPRWKARIVAAMATMHKYPDVSLTLETEHHHEVIRTHVLMVSNNSYDLSRLGIEAPRQTLNEGRLSVYWLPHTPRMALFSFGAHFLAGRVHEAPGFRSFRTARIKLQTSHRSLRLGIDGEVTSVGSPTTITIVPTALLVKVPRPPA